MHAIGRAVNPGVPWRAPWEAAAIEEGSAAMADERDEQMPTTEELEEPSTEKDPGEEPKAPAPHDPEPDHHAVGPGVIGYAPESGDAESPAQPE